MADGDSPVEGRFHGLAEANLVFDHNPVRKRDAQRPGGGVGVGRCLDKAPDHDSIHEEAALVDEIEAPVLDDAAPRQLDFGGMLEGKAADRCDRKAGDTAHEQSLDEHDASRLTRDPGRSQPSLVPGNQPKNLNRPDESVRLPGVEEDLVHAGDEIVARIVQHPGWRWSSDMRAIAGGQWCETHHVGLNLSGRQGATLRDGTVLEFGPDDIYDIPPGHDGYTIGDEPCVMIEWSGPRTWAGRNARFLDRELVTLLMTDIVESTAVLSRIGDAAWRDLIGRHVARARQIIAEFRGTEVDLAGDGFLATFDGPARALRCAVAIGRAALDDGFRIRAAVHVGEVEAVGDRVRGLAVVEVARILGLAGPGEVLVSQVTRDLSVGSGLTFEDRGMHVLKGMAEERRLFAMTGPEVAPPVSGSTEGLP